MQNLFDNLTPEQQRLIDLAAFPFEGIVIRSPEAKSAFRERMAQPDGLEYIRYLADINKHPKIMEADQARRQELKDQGLAYIDVRAQTAVQFLESVKEQVTQSEAEGALATAGQIVTNLGKEMDAARDPLIAINERYNNRVKEVHDILGDALREADAVELKKWRATHPQKNPLNPSENTRGSNVR